ncbi:uncharacterized protein LOC114359035 isoform X2 [Ostrinia furnacalis]|uniref:uncharacterized protein LOC114359035 isoform X2 n=1 Tax=Ostrinia furnacalis TaxID=93504 RepID=UPI00103E132A|nr:uncharacterized protein LOC114359035 isoform X2 [Ostrinia furnacalis]
MANALGVCLLSIALFCCTNLSLARQVPKECSKGPVYWCQNLKQGADCGAVGHCIGTVWESQNYDVTSNEVSDKFVRLFRQLKDVKDLINEEYLSGRVASACHDVPYKAMASACKENTAGLHKYLYHVLLSGTSPEGMCQIIGMCNNEKLDHLINNNKKKAEPKKQANQKIPLVGASRCTWGPSYWCNNFSTGHECHATKHCVERVWPKIQFPEDNDSVCKICTDMVKQARDQLESNQTQNDLKDVFEGSCKLMPIKIVAKECMKLADDFVPELVETLASEMNPQAVCSVAGLCNSARIDKLLEEQAKEVAPKKQTKLLGGIKCTQGPAYWCSNFATGRECSATKFCAGTVWSTTKYPQDNDNICKICTDMVTQARDQLESNETQEELKEVFEGSCKLIPIKIVAKECMKMADDFVPELVETLASQMNPQAVCSVAGLCNSARIDQLLEAYNTQLTKVVNCNNCRQTVAVARRRFEATSYEDFLLSLLQVCRNMDSLSDSCSMLIFQYYENILEAVKKDLTPESVCHVSGQCTYRFHTHDQFTFPEFEPQPTDDVPCEFCEQLVKHMRDTLVANTTELEFYKVLKGLCKQTGNFKTECLHLAEQYYPIVYHYLVSDLQPNKVCQLMGMCGKKLDTPIAPLLPKELVIKSVATSPKLIGTDEANSYKVNTKQENVRIMDTEDLPPLTLDRMFVRMPQSKAGCSFCQYFLHYLQVELSDSRTEDEIKEAVNKACDRLPKSIDGECRTFVTNYGPAVIALLVQEIDPASVCPALGLCEQTQEVRKVSINFEKSNCPLCLFAVEQLETMLKNNRTEENIRHALDNLCDHLSTKLQTECVDFVDAYTNQLVEMLVANMDAQEVCVYLKLCTDTSIKTDPLKITHSSIDKFHDIPQLNADRNNRKKSMLPAHMLVNGDIETNEIPDDTVNGRPINKVSQKTVCVVCEFVMKEIDEQIKDKHNEDEIKKIVHGVCRHMPKSVRAECDQFVEKYADLVISLLAQELEPDQVCQQLKLCDPQIIALDGIRAEEILDCAVCETVVLAVKKVLNNDKVDRNIVHIVEKSCALLPAKYYDRCHTMMEIYGDSVIHLIETMGVKGVCQKIGLCSASEAFVVDMHKGNH